MEKYNTIQNIFIIGEHNEKLMEKSETIKILL